MGRKVCLWLKNIAINLAVIAFLVGVGYLTAFLIDEYGMAVRGDTNVIQFRNLCIRSDFSRVTTTFALS